MTELKINKCFLKEMLIYSLQGYKGILQAIFLKNGYSFVISAFVI